MDLREIDLNLLLAFEALMAARSVTGAAARLGLRQPAMSAALSRLRAAFGDELFVRVNAIRPVPVIDALLAATAKANGLTLVTRNSTDVAGLDVDVLNPFDAT